MRKKRRGGSRRSRRYRTRRTDWFKAQAGNERYEGEWFKGFAQGGCVDSNQEEEEEGGAM